MNSTLKLYLTPLIATVCFFGGVYATLSIGAPATTGVETAEAEDDDDGLTTTQMSFPVYANEKRIGHCVLAVRVQEYNEEDPVSLLPLNTLSKQLYEKASGSFLDVQDGSIACADFKTAAQEDHAVLSASFMREDDIPQ